MKTNDLHTESLAIKAKNERTSNAEHLVLLYLTSSYVFDDAEDMRSQFPEESEGHIYS